MKILNIFIAASVLLGSVPSFANNSVLTLIQCTVKGNTGVNVRLSRDYANGLASIERSFDNDVWENIFSTREAYIWPQTDGSVTVEYYDSANGRDLADGDVARFALDRTYNATGTGAYLSKVLDKLEPIFELTDCAGTLDPSN
jgi:hypothetical protein